MSKRLGGKKVSKSASERARERERERATMSEWASVIYFASVGVIEGESR